jgi:CsoR family transcriptional regulator, copper-sensing transcriptional repressor
MASSGMESESAPAIIARLRRIEGQLRGLQNMISEGRPCAEVTIQLAAAKAALGKAGAQYVANHLAECAIGGSTKDLAGAVDMLVKFA